MSEDSEPEQHESDASPKRWFHLKAMRTAIVGADDGQSIRDYRVSADDDGTVERTNRRLQQLALERAGLRLWRGVIVVGLAGIPIAFLVAVPEWHHGVIHSVHWVLGGSLGYGEFFLLVVLLFVRARVAGLNAELRVLEYDIVLTSFDKEHQKRAANLFFKHQAELKQYYDQTLRQNKQAFLMGLGCVGFGLAATVAIGTLLLVESHSTTPARLTAGAMGILSALLSGFVARIYLRVYDRSAEALSGFHERLVATNHYHFANLLISMIEPEDRRMSALSTLADGFSPATLPTATDDV
jgi:hypothetical protein